LGKNKRFEDIEELLNTLESMGLEYTEGGSQPHYNTSTKKIAIPRIGQADSSEFYYQYLFHEIGHWLVDKLEVYKDKKTDTRIKHAREELIVEFFSAYVCHLYDIDMIQESTEYLAEWLRKLDNDPYMLVSASAQAEKLIKYVFNPVEDEELKKETA